MISTQLTTLIDELITECEARNISGSITIYGGTAMLYYFHDLRSTIDVDATFVPYEEIKQVSTTIASRHNIPNDWFNSAVHDCIPPQPDPCATLYYRGKNLSVFFASQEYLLAMKASSSRRSEKDLLDAATLFNALDLNSTSDIERIVSTYFNSTQFGEELFFEDIVDLANELKGQQ